MIVRRREEVEDWRSLVVGREESLGDDDDDDDFGFFESVEVVEEVAGT